MIFGQILTKPSVTSAPVLEPATQHGTQGRCSSAGPNNLQVLETGTSQATRAGCCVSQGNAPGPRGRSVTQLAVH